MTAEQASQAISKDAADRGGYVVNGENESGNFDSYLVGIQLTTTQEVEGRPDIEGRMLCDKFDIKLHVIKKHTTVEDGDIIAHQLIDCTGSKSIDDGEVGALYGSAEVLHILNEGCAHFVPILPKVSTYGKKHMVEQDETLLNKENKDGATPLHMDGLNNKIIAYISDDSVETNRGYHVNDDGGNQQSMASPSSVEGDQPIASSSPVKNDQPVVSPSPRLLREYLSHPELIIKYSNIDLNLEKLFNSIKNFIKDEKVKEIHLSNVFILSLKQDSLKIVEDLFLLFDEFKDKVIVDVDKNLLEDLLKNICNNELYNIIHTKNNPYNINVLHSFTSSRWTPVFLKLEQRRIHVKYEFISSSRIHTKIKVLLNKNILPSKTMDWINSTALNISNMIKKEKDSFVAVQEVFEEYIEDENYEKKYLIGIILVLSRVIKDDKEYVISDDFIKETFLSKSSDDSISESKIHAMAILHDLKRNKKEYIVKEEIIKKVFKIAVNNSYLEVIDALLFSRRDSENDSQSNFVIEDNEIKENFICILDDKDNSTIIERFLKINRDSYLIDKDFIIKSIRDLNEIKVKNLLSSMREGCCIIDSYFEDIFIHLLKSDISSSILEELTNLVEHSSFENEFLSGLFEKLLAESEEEKDIAVNNLINLRVNEEYIINNDFVANFFAKLLNNSTDSTNVLNKLIKLKRCDEYIVREKVVDKLIYSLKYSTSFTKLINLEMHDRLTKDDFIKLFKVLAGRNRSDMIKIIIDAKAKGQYLINEFDAEEALILPAKKGFESIVELIINKDHLNMTEDSIEKILIIAAENGRKEVVNLILKCKPEINRENAATKAMQLDYKELAIELGYKYDDLSLSSSSSSPQAKRIRLSSINNSYSKIKQSIGMLASKLNSRLSKSSPELNQSNSSGEHMRRSTDLSSSSVEDESCSLILAVQNGHNDVVQTLLDQGADVNAKTHEELTALHFAVQNGHNDVVQTLLDQGADVNAKTHEELTALHFAVQNGHNDVVQTLLDQGADVNAETIEKWTALDLAIDKSYLNICYKIIKCGLSNKIYTVDGLNTYREKINDLIIKELSNGLLNSNSEVFLFFLEKKMFLKKTYDFVDKHNGEKYSNIETDTSSSKSETDTSSSKSETDTNNEVISSNKNRVRTLTENDDKSSYDKKRPNLEKTTEKIAQAMVSNNETSNLTEIVTPSPSTSANNMSSDPIEVSVNSKRA